MIEGGIFLSALVGSAIGGGVTALLNISDRRSRARSVTVAIEAEVAAICELLRSREFLEVYSGFCDKIDAGTWTAADSLTVDVHTNHFVVFEGLAADLGLVEPDKLQNFIRFYNFAKSWLNLTRPDGALVDNTPEQMKLELKAVVDTLENLLELGDKIAEKNTNKLSLKRRKISQQKSLTQ